MRFPFLRPMLTHDDYGRIAYEAYCETSHGKSLVSGAELPAWSDLRMEIRVAWINSAVAVLER